VGRLNGGNVPLESSAWSDALSKLPDKALRFYAEKRGVLVGTDPDREALLASLRSQAPDFGALSPVQRIELEGSIAEGLKERDTAAERRLDLLQRWVTLLGTTQALLLAFAAFVGVAKVLELSELRSVAKAAETSAEASERQNAAIVSHVVNSILDDCATTLENLGPKGPSDIELNILQRHATSISAILESAGSRTPIDPCAKSVRELMEALSEYGAALKGPKSEQVRPLEECRAKFESGLVQIEAIRAPTSGSRFAGHRLFREFRCMGHNALASISIKLSRVFRQEANGATGEEALHFKKKSEDCLNDAIQAATASLDANKTFVRAIINRGVAYGYKAVDAGTDDQPQETVAKLFEREREAYSDASYCAPGGELRSIIVNDRADSYMEEVKWLRRNDRREEAAKRLAEAESAVGKALKEEGCAAIVFITRAQIRCERLGIGLKDRTLDEAAVIGLVDQVIRDLATAVDRGYREFSGIRSRAQLFAIHPYLQYIVDARGEVVLPSLFEAVRFTPAT